MSFAGGTGHKSPFAERAKATKSHLSPRRGSSASGLGSHARTPQQSLFGKESAVGKDSPLGDSSAKVGQLRNAQPEIKEPTTPTRASEGSTVKGSRRDEFSSFNSRRVGTPIKTPRTAFGTIAPRSPQRPHMGSPKYQKVLLERPAFYNSPTAAVESQPIAGAGRKEVTISELQKRLRRFLQVENVPAPGDHQLSSSCEHLDELPYNFSRSPRVNPLFHHDETVLHVARGGVSFTAGATDAATVFARPEGEDFTALAARTTCTTHLQPVSLFSEPPDVSTPSPPRIRAVETPASPTASHTSDAAPHGDDPVSDAPCDACGSPDTERPLRSEDFPVHSEPEEAGFQVEEGGEVQEEECAGDPSVGMQAQSPLIAAAESITSEETEVTQSKPLLMSPIVELHKSEGEEPIAETHEAHEVEQVDDQPEPVVEPGLVTECVFEETEEEEESEIVRGLWFRWFLRFAVLAVTAACVMGIMALTSGSEDLVQFESLRSTGPLRHLPASSSEIPTSMGFMQMGKEHEGMQRLPAVLESEELKTVTEYYKELQGKLYLDVFSLTSESALSDAVSAGTAMGEVSEVDGLDANTEDVLAEEAVMEDALETPEDPTELVNEIAEVLLPEETLPSSDEHSPEDTAQSSRGTEDSQALSEPSPEVETPQLPADVELDASNPASDSSDDELQMENTTSPESTDPSTSTLKDLEPEEGASSVSVAESAFRDIPSDPNEDICLPIESRRSTEEVSTGPASFSQGADEINRVNVEDLVGDLEQSHRQDLESESTVEAAAGEELSGADPESNVVVSEELGSEKEEESEVNGLLLVTAMVLVVALAAAVPRFLKSRRAAPSVTTAQPEAEPWKPTDSTPAPWQPTRSGYDTHIPGRDELDAVSSPLKGLRTQRPFGADRPARRDAFSVEPASSAPGVYQARARMEPSRPATTWHPAMRAAGCHSVSSSGYRQTASYIPTIPSESAISTSTRGASDLDSVCESVLSMGAEEWEHLGSFTTTEVVSMNEGGEEQKIRTPVRRSQRIRNRASPLPVSFT